MASLSSRSRLALSSRFSVLSVEENSGSEPKHQKKKSAKIENETKTTPVPNSDEISKKKKPNGTTTTTTSIVADQDAELRQLRGMAFLSSKKSKKQPKQGNGDGRPKSAKKSAQWDEWKSKDEQFVDKKFEKDLIEALEESKSSFLEQPKPKIVVPDGATTVKKHEKEKQSGKKKEKVNSNSMQSTVPQKGQSPSAVDPTLISDNLKNDEPATTSRRSKKGDASSAKKKTKPESLEKENVKYIAESVRVVQLEDELSKKNTDVEQLTSTVEELKKELSQVRKRNQQLCFILGQGEMKDKSEVLTQVEELTNIKDELTEEVAMLHRELEQERSKVSSLKSELTKYQHQDGRKKHE